MDRTNVPKFDENIYSKVGLNDLVTYAVYYLSESRSEITAEDIVAACFLMFPKRFSLRGYADWPDSTVVNKRWVDCRDKRLISGNTANGFKLTPNGLELAEKTNKVLKGERPAFSTRSTKRVRTEMRTRAGRFVKAIEESDAYKGFQSGRTNEISESIFEACCCARWRVQRQLWRITYSNSSSMRPFTIDKTCATF